HFAGSASEPTDRCHPEPPARPAAARAASRAGAGRFGAGAGQDHRIRVPYVPVPNPRSVRLLHLSILVPTLFHGPAGLSLRASVAGTRAGAVKRASRRGRGGRRGTAKCRETSYMARFPGTCLAPRMLWLWPSVSEALTWLVTLLRIFYLA